ncbi:MAG TPA: 2-aminoethylphosphonate--pyruvate transaminase [Hyphomicrobiaceae bacterium]|nr:2-aminoethylphosphonate--pyruvate transaminase [Hyphomicrobiaceae bacterium]
MAQSPLLFTPGPLTTQCETRRAMLNDWGSREPAFIAMTAELRRRLLDVAGGQSSHVAVPIQGSGTFIVEAAIGTLVRPSDVLLVLANGAYGERMIEIARRLGRRAEALRWPEDQAVEPGTVERALADNPAITHVGLVHCETTSGLLNPLAEVAAVVAQQRRAFIVDAMSSFGALPLDLRQTPITALLASSNKCLEGVPGIAFALIEKRAIELAKDVAPSLSLDLYDQWRGFESNGQWRFTPPVQVVAALLEALRGLEAEGGPAGRLQRYRENCRTLTEGMRRLGFRVFLDRDLQAPVIVTFVSPEDPRFRFDDLYNGLAARGFIIYPGKLTQAQSFRIGCIGALHAEDFDRLVAAVADIVADFGLTASARVETAPHASYREDRSPRGSSSIASSSPSPCAIILAAGVGRRLGQAVPKVLLEFGGKSLLERHLAALRANNVRNVSITVGHRPDLISAELSRLGVRDRVTLVENPRYREGSVISVAAQRAQLAAGKPVLLMDGDVLYDSRMLARLLQAAPENVLLFDRAIEPGDEPVKICLRGEVIVDFAKVPEHAHDRHGESVGFFRFSASMATALAERATAYVDGGRASAEYEAVIRDLIVAHPNRVGVEDISDLPWTEIDFEADVVRARQEVLPRLQETTYA